MKETCYVFWFALPVHVRVVIFYDLLITALFLMAQTNKHNFLFLFLAI